MLIGGFAVILRCGCVLATTPTNPLTLKMVRGRAFRGCLRCEELREVYAGVTNG